MTSFGDADPEDAYDAVDPPTVRFDTLSLWVGSVALEQATGGHDHVRVLTRIQTARWASGVLGGEALNIRQRFRLEALQEWLDDLLELEGV